MDEQDTAWRIRVPYMVWRSRTTTRSRLPQWGTRSQVGSGRQLCHEGQTNPKDPKSNCRASAGRPVMRIRTVKPNNHKKAFEVAISSKQYWLPYAKLEVRPSRQNPIKRVYIDKEIGSEGFTYELASGEEGTVHLDHVLDYNRDPRYLQNLLLYKLTLAAQKQVKTTPLSKRELIRRLGTSPAQFYRLLDQTNYAKSINQMMSLLSILDCDLDVVITERRTPQGNCQRGTASESVRAT
jgi:hypothetical protein